MQGGSEWFIDALGCQSETLRALEAVRSICDRVIDEMSLHVVGDPQWHQFPGEAGVTGMYLLSESHLTCHTFPESGLATFNLFCCRPRPPWPWEPRLAELLGAESVRIRQLTRLAAPYPVEPVDPSICGDLA